MNKLTPRTNAFAKKIGHILAKLASRDISLMEASEHAQALIDEHVGEMEKELTGQKHITFRQALDNISEATRIAREVMIREFPVGCTITYKQGSRSIVAEVVEHHDFALGLNVRGLNSGKTYRLDPYRITSVLAQST